MAEHRVGGQMGPPHVRGPESCSYGLSMEEREGDKERQRET